MESTLLEALHDGGMLNHWAVAFEAHNLVLLSDWDGSDLLKAGGNHRWAEEEINDANKYS